ncbi:acyl-CoA dehydrogenase family protein [Dyella terrae]|uniref:acyl-CoA dehydrogenase family protein n=1 Tax=Dyella terrae TaxID=522259 RepID=UPI001EFCBC46|nr:acyl-CoA dehydrogenase family protein [Dyella terrae]ULU24178.1 acyl-CoA dehydrogenase family protein [Dyella terrae]
MNFQPTEDQQLLADSLGRYIATRYDFATRDRIAHSKRGYDVDQWRQFGELGVIGALFDESNGGYGGDPFDIAMVFEALGRALVVEPFLDSLMVGRAIARFGNTDQRTLLAAIIHGETHLAWAHDEPGSHYETSRVATLATAAGDGWFITGAKAVVQHGNTASHLLVSARTSGDTESEQGITLFLLPRDTAGLELRDYPKIDGGRTAEVVLNHVRAEHDAVVGKVGLGSDVLEYVQGYGVLALCAEALGAMEVAKVQTLDYLRTRKQFGQPIGSFQALQHRMADLLIEIEQARSAVINAAAAMHGHRYERERALSAAKVSMGHIGTRVAEECIQLHGGIGMTWELPLSHYAKRLVMIDHQLGDEDHHLARYMALGRGETP